MRVPLRERLVARGRGGGLRARRRARRRSSASTAAVGDRAGLAELLAARSLGAAVLGVGAAAASASARAAATSSVRGPRTRERVARLGLRERGLGGGDARLREPIVEPREHLAGVHGVALVDLDLGDPALGLERELDGIADRLDAAGRDERRRPRASAARRPRTAVA